MKNITKTKLWKMRSDKLSLILGIITGVLMLISYLLGNKYVGEISATIIIAVFVVYLLMVKSLFMNTDLFAGLKFFLANCLKFMESTLITSLFLAFFVGLAKGMVVLHSMVMTVLEKN